MAINFPEMENKILKFWKDKKIFDKLKKKNYGKKHWSFLDGPITANNPMGVHHAWGRTYKDLFQRQKAMQGFDQRYQNGFDCQGLWVEVEVEKEMGFKTKKDIEKFGIGKFVEACKQRVLKFSKIQTDQSIRLGQWMDWDNSYFTMSDQNNYSIWGFLKKCQEKGYLYKGKDSVPWCPRCGTAISQHEILTEEYKEITHKAVYFKLPIIENKEFENTYFLVWTTTPWTIPANVALAVNPDFKYGLYKKNKKIEIKNKKNKNNNEKFILLKSLAEKVLDESFELEKEFSAKKLIGIKYQGPFDELERVKQAKKENLSSFHTVIEAKDLVTDQEGTGIVHIATGAGAEDFKLGKEKNLPVIDVIDEQAIYLESMDELTGKNAKEKPEIIFDWLKKYQDGKFFYKIENYTHRYPTCWRCKTELVWRAVDEWYISMDKLRKPLMEVSKKINWIPSFGLERELDWLKNMDDWLISKKRYWGLALPIYECQKCNNFEVIGSKEELKERAVSGWKEFEGNSPHRPWIDKVKIKCSKCDEIVSRILDVGNPWLDAGIVAFSTMGYFEDKNNWKKWFPVDLICESFPGQFKNWFYALIVMSVVLEDTNPSKTIFGFASVRDEKGEEMHKSKGNAIWFDTAVEKIGADPMRWMYARQNPANNLKFGYHTAEEIKRKLITLYNVFTFFDTYIDKKEISEINLKINSKNILDKWIVSCFNNLIVKTSKNFDKYDAVSGILAIENFFIEDLSLWYVRRSRKRFHNAGEDRKQAIETLYYILLNLSKIIAPAIPFFAEEIYSNLKMKDMPESVHLCDWLKSDENKINQELEEKMKLVRETVTLALAQRAEQGIKVRQPLQELTIKNKELKNEKELLGLIKDEVNVKSIAFGKEIKLDIKMTKELQEEGRYREMVRSCNKLRKEKGLTPDIVIDTYCTGSVPRIWNEEFIKETNSNAVEIKSFDDIKKEDDVYTEMKLEKGKKDYIGIKVIKT
ncbi:MAG: isoleucine--tRNA ligase [Candidatus Nealsonbacteria bacterium]